jgi:hypothetical protein
MALSTWRPGFELPAPWRPASSGRRPPLEKRRFPNASSMGIGCQLWRSQAANNHNPDTSSAPIPIPSTSEERHPRNGASMIDPGSMEARRGQA